MPRPNSASPRRKPRAPSLPDEALSVSFFYGLRFSDCDGVRCLVRIDGGSESPVGFLLSGVTATLSDQLGSAVFYCSGVGLSGVSLEFSVSYVDAATVEEEIEVKGKLLRAGKSVGVVFVDFRKKRTGKLLAQASHTKYLAVSSRL